MSTRSTGKLRPRRQRIIGFYCIPYCPGLYAIEVFVPLPPFQVDFGDFPGYRPPAWDFDWGVGAAHFYLSDDGTKLIGSYLGRGTQPDEAEDHFTLEFFRRTRHLTTRAVLLLSWDQFPRSTWWGSLRLPRETPIPERLLRLIWVEEGMASLSDDAAFGDDV